MTGNKYEEKTLSANRAKVGKSQFLWKFLKSKKQTSLIKDFWLQNYVFQIAPEHIRYLII